MRTKVAVVQMTSTPEVTANLAKATTFVTAAAEDGAKLVVLPECFASFGPEESKFAVAEPLPEGGPILDEMRALARRLGVELVLGGFWERGGDPKRVRNSSVFVDASGAVRAVYRKIHLYDVELSDGTSLCESAGVEPGTDAVVTDSVAGRLGLSVCYDVRFPELYRRLVDEGATLLTVPAAFTVHTGKDHWHVLLRARAIESQAYVLAAAQTGKHYGSRTTYGHAVIVDPWGTVLAEHGEGEGFVSAVVDQNYVAKVRRELPSLAHRRLR